MKITIEGEPKEIADLATHLQNRLSPEDMNSYLDEFRGKLKEMLKNQITKELSSANRDNT